MYPLEIIALIKPDHIFLLTLITLLCLVLMVIRNAAKALLKETISPLNERDQNVASQAASLANALSLVIFALVLCLIVVLAYIGFNLLPLLPVN